MVREAASGWSLHTPRDVQVIRSAIKEGLPKERFINLGKALGVQAAELGNIVAISERTLSRRKGNFTPQESDRILQVDSTFARATEVLGSEERAREWMNRSNRSIEGKTPLEYCDTSFGVREVNNLLGRIEHAVIA